MLKRAYIFLIASFSVFCALGQPIIGEVSDKNGSPLAFVNLLALPGQQGTMTDINGKFMIIPKENQQFLAVSYVGYEPQRINIASIDRKKVLKIVLQPTSFSLSEVIIDAGENPAHAIIRRVTQNADLHNPNRLSSYRYDSYNKFVFTLDSNLTYFNTSTNAKKVEEKLKTMADSSQLAMADSANNEIRLLVAKQHLFLTETVTRKTFKAPIKSFEEILASKVSGFQSPTLILLASQLQSFSFYDDYISLLELQYLNPIAHGSIPRYFFHIEDTTYNGNDSIFQISFKPRPNKNANGMKGVLYINSNGWAIQNVIAEPAEIVSEGLQIKIQQQYQKVGDKWFPTQLYTDLYMKLGGFENWQIKGNGQTFLRNIATNIPIDKKENRFNGIELNSQSAIKDTSYWQQIRYEPLSAQDLETYRILDSLGQAHKFDQRLMWLQALTTGKLPIGKININLDQLFNYSHYEGFRLGLGAETNNKVSKWWGVGGYFAYGFRDKTSKYGAHTWLNLDKAKQQQVRLSYSSDLVENGAQNFIFDRSGKTADLIRRNYLYFFDKTNQVRLTYSIRAINGWSFQIGAFQETREETPGNTEGMRLNKGVFKETQSPNRWQNSALTTSVRYARGEQYLKTEQSIMVLAPTFKWIYWLNFTRGSVSQNEIGTVYNQLDFKALRTYKIRHIGNTTLQFSAGATSANLPATLLFFANANTSNQGGLYVPFAFQSIHAQTMLANRFVNGFLIHNFGNLLLKTKKFRPNLIWLLQGGFGGLANKADYSRDGDWPISSYEKGLYETGIIIDNIIGSSFSSLGIGGFTRFGPYMAPRFADNLFFKFSFSSRIAR